MSKLSLSAITATYLSHGDTGSVLVSCFQQVTQPSDAITVEIMCDAKSEI